MDEMKKVNGYQDLNVWKKSMDLVVDIYKLIKTLPKIETYNLSDQMRRAATSIPSNIAEGSGRNSTKEYIQFLYIALGSACELETQLLIIQRLGYQQSVSSFIIEISQIKKMLNALISSLKRSSSTPKIPKPRNLTPNTQNPSPNTNTNTKNGVFT
jgi:four helix bundle protein